MSYLSDLTDDAIVDLWNSRNVSQRELEEEMRRRGFVTRPTTAADSRDKLDADNGNRLVVAKKKAG